MLKNTLSPDGFPLTRDGKRLVDQELLPGTFPGSKEDFILLYEDYADYWNNFDQPFNISFNEVFSTILKVYNSGDYENARFAIRYIDFTPYIASEQQNHDYYLELLNKLSISNDNYYNNSTAVINQITLWDILG